MVSPAEFLTKQLHVQKEIITFRCLSRALSMHVNDAKNELASFHASSKTTDSPVHATFLLTGYIAPVNASGSYPDENDMEVDEDDQYDEVPVTKILLVGENELEAAKTQFTRLSSVHIYSLSPSKIRDAALLAPIADRVRQYYSKGKEFHQTVGVVIGPDVKLSTSQNDWESAATSSKSKTPAPEKKLVETAKSSDNSDNRPEKGKTVSKNKGTLDWSKAKPKAEKKKGVNSDKDLTKNSKKEKEIHTAAVKTESKGKERERERERVVVKKEKQLHSETLMKMESEESDPAAKKGKASEKSKRGTKRPSAVMSLSDSEEEQHDDNPAPKTRSRPSASPLPRKPNSASEKGAKVKKGVLVSDEEDGMSSAKSMLSRQKGKGKGKGRVLLSDDEDAPDCSASAIMDLDDSHFTRHNQIPTEPQSKREEEEEVEDVEMASDFEPIPTRAKSKRKPKKVIPIGSNGLPKKRIVKSKRSKDKRGYTITVDYSSYESASESEQMVDALESKKKAKKGKNNSKKADAAAAEEPVASEARTKPSSNRSTTENRPSPASQSKSTGPDSASKSDTKNHGSNSRVTKSNNCGKSNLMNYFEKK